MQTLKFLGRGSAFNTKEGNTSAYIKEGSTLLLIDCGESVFDKIIEKNVLDGVEKVNVLITHLHSDHVGSLSTFIYYCFYALNIMPRVIFPNASLYNFLKMCGNENVCDCLILNTEYRIADNLFIKPIPTSHMNNMDSYGYLIKYNKKEIYFSGDSDCVNRDAKTLLLGGYIDEFYQDTCYKYHANSVHLPFTILCSEINERLRSKVYCMHIDTDKLIPLIKEHKFNLVECE